MPGKIYQILLTVICINPLANKPILQLGIRSTICNGYKKSSEAKNAADNFIFSGLIGGDCLLPAIIARAVLAGGKICTLLSTLYSVQEVKQSQIIQLNIPYYPWLDIPRKERHMRQPYCLPCVFQRYVIKKYIENFSNVHNSCHQIVNSIHAIFLLACLVL